MAKLFTLIGNMDEAEKSQVAALDMYKKCAPSDTRLDGEISQNDFDDIVTFASK